MRRVECRSLSLWLLVISVLALLIGCRSETDEQLLTKINPGLQIGSFRNQPEALMAVSKLLSRGHAKANDPKLVDCLITTGALLLTDNAEWTDREEARNIYDLLKRYDNETVVDGLVRKVIQGGVTSAPAPAPAPPAPGPAAPAPPSPGPAPFAPPTPAVDGHVRKVIQDETSRLHVLFLGVKLGIPGSQQRLNKVLDECGDNQMAEDFLNSGSSELYEGGKRWANNHGYSIMSGMGSHRVSWGNF